MESAAENLAELGTGDRKPASGDAPAALADLVPQRPRLFNFDAQGIRVIGSSETPRFVATDVLSALGLGATRVTEALDSLEDDEKGYGSIVTLGGVQEVRTITESGLYALIFRSRKPQARLFRRWVTGEVLPAIRRTGAYSAPNPSPQIPSPTPALAALPPPATLESHVAHVLLATIAFPRDFGFVHPVEIARAAVVTKRFTEVCSDPSDYQHVSRLLRLFQGRGCFRRWLRADSGDSCASRGGWLVYCEPHGRNRHRRYSITSRKEDAA